MDGWMDGDRARHSYNGHDIGLIIPRLLLLLWSRDLRCMLDLNTIVHQGGWGGFCVYGLFKALIELVYNRILSQ